METEEVIQKANRIALKLYGWYEDVVMIPFQKNLHSSEETITIAMQHKRKEFIYQKRREDEINKFFDDLKKYCNRSPQVSYSFAQFGTTHCGTDTNTILVGFHTAENLQVQSSKKLLKKSNEIPKQLKVEVSKQAFKEFVHSTIRDISLKD